MRKLRSRSKRLAPIRSQVPVPLEDQTVQADWGGQAAYRFVALAGSWTLLEAKDLR